MNEELLQKLLSTAAKQTGVSEQELQQRLEQGNLQGMAGVDALLNNPKALEEAIRNPKVQAILKQLGN